MNRTVPFIEGKLEPAEHAVLLLTVVFFLQ